MDEEKNALAPCSTCLRKTNHDILFSKSLQDEVTIDTHVLLECRGCGTISMAHQRLWTDDGSKDHDYYPSPITRKQPEWALHMLAGVHGYGKEQDIGALLGEVYAAVAGGQHRLAAIGIRALLEQVMILKVGDLRTFDLKLDAFQEQGYISLLQRDALRATLDLGDAAMHRRHRPSEDDQTLALNIVEGVLAPIYAHKDLAIKLAESVPQRKKPQT
jgi:hypothetical protein